MLERVQKFLSSAGVSSRRKAEEFIQSGQVFINGRKAKLGDKVDPARDEVKVYGKIVKPSEQKIYVMLNKPKGYLVSKSDPKGKKTVFDLLPPELRGKVWNVGRLDFDTEGLLILTNDGELTQQLAHPKYEHEKEYEVQTQEEPFEGQLERLRAGVEISTGTTYPAKVKRFYPHPPRPLGQRAGHLLPPAFVRPRRTSAGKQGEGKNGYAPCVRITLHEGKKRQVRRMFSNVGLTVTSLKRIRVNRLTLPKDLALGQYRLIAKQDIL